MSDTVGRFRDTQGRVHSASCTSKFVIDGLARGELVDVAVEQEALAATEQERLAKEGNPGDTSDDEAGDDHKPRRRDRRSRDAEQAAGSTDDTSDKGVVEPKVDG